MEAQQGQEEEQIPLELQITFDRSTSTYKPTDWITGNVKVINPMGGLFPAIQSRSLKIQAEGVLTAQNRTTNKQLEQITQNMPPTDLFRQEVIVAEDVKVTEADSFPFKFKFMPLQDQELSETYVGVYISVAYEINCVMRQYDGKKITGAAPFFVQCPGQGKKNVKGEFKMPRPCSIEMSPEKLLIQNQQQTVPDFKIKGMLETDIAYFHDDIRGSFVIDDCDGKIRTIDLQLIRVEKIENNIGRFQEATEIQLIQVADGNVSRKLEIPFYMIYPIYFSCPNFINKEYQVDFEVNFIMILFDGFKITMNFPLNIIRH